MPRRVGFRSCFDPGFDLATQYPMLFPRSIAEDSMVQAARVQLAEDGYELHIEVERFIRADIRRREQARNMPICRMRRRAAIPVL